MGRSFDVPAPIPLPEQTGASFGKLVELMQRLLSPDGCPWDRDQTPLSLRQYVLEEACEVIDAIEGGEGAELCEELGDLSLQIAFLAELSRRQGRFGPDDVMRGICEKLVRRHPHVFGETSVSGAGEVVENWEAIKRREKKGRPLLDGVPRSLPALMRAQRIGDRVARIGFDWPDSQGSREKIDEELSELDEAVASSDAGRIRAELGDLLFALVNFARHNGVDPEEALRETADRFSRRFSHVEERVKAEHGDWPRDARGKPSKGVPLAELDGYWNEAKRENP